MKYILLLIITIIGCNNKIEPFEPEVVDWSQRTTDISQMDSLVHGKSYLSVYSQIYSFSQHQKYNMTGMISLRNVSERDTIYLTRADYFNTEGEKIRSYFDKPVFVKPMETIEIVIAQEDTEGGTGSNFLFEWKTLRNCPEPIFEGVMNSMQGTQGVSFTTHGKRIE